VELHDGPTTLFRLAINYFARASEKIPAIKKKEAKRQATAAAKILLELAASTAQEDLDLARQQAALARRLMLRYNVRFDWDLKRFYCHGCKQLIVPGVNARVRLAGDFVLTTCANCGRVNRKSLAQA
jgi:RNase P subunit RPR2